MIVTSLLFSFQTFAVFADDGGPNSLFWIKDDKIVCISISNPEETPSNNVLVYDYSPRIGEKMGKPWVIVQKGKCYEFEAGVSENGIPINNVRAYNHGAIYLLEEKYFEELNTQSHQPSEDIPVNPDIKPIWYFDYSGILTVNVDDYMHFTQIEANMVIPTKYELGENVTTYTSDSMPFKQMVISNPNYSEAGSLYSTLARQLEETVRKCDNRIRTEHQYELSFYREQYRLQNKTTVWRMKVGDVVLDNNTFSSEIFDGNNNPLQIINLIGCRASYINYINQNKDVFKNIDTLAEAVLSEYSDYSFNDYGDDISRYVYEKDEKVLAAINTFLISPAPTLNPALWQKKKTTPIPSIKISTTTPRQITADYVQTTLDEPSIKVKREIVNKSNNPFVTIFFFLPFISLSIILLLLINNKKIKNKPFNDIPRTKVRGILSILDDTTILHPRNKLRGIANRENK